MVPCKTRKIAVFHIYKQFATEIKIIWHTRVNGASWNNKDLHARWRVSQKGHVTGVFSYDIVNCMAYCQAQASCTENLYSSRTAIIAWRITKRSIKEYSILHGAERVLPEQLTGLQLVKKFPAFHGTRRFITALTSVRHLNKQSRTADEGWSSSLGVGRGAKNPSL